MIDTTWRSCRSVSGDRLTQPAWRNRWCVHTGRNKTIAFAYPFISWRYQRLVFKLLPGSKVSPRYIVHVTQFSTRLTKSNLIFMPACKIHIVVSSWEAGKKNNVWYCVSQLTYRLLVVINLGTQIHDNLHNPQLPMSKFWTLCKHYKTS